MTDEKRKPSEHYCDTEQQIKACLNCKKYRCDNCAANIPREKYFERRKQK